MSEPVLIEYVAEPSTADLAILTHGISLEAKAKKSQKEIISYAFFLKDQSNEIKGGINGNVLYGCLSIDQLWIDKSLRGKHYGIELMKKAESFGLENHCRFANVHTMDWEAKDFYIKLGYKVESQIEGFDNDSICYFLRKELGR